MAFHYPPPIMNILQCAQDGAPFLFMCLTSLSPTRLICILKESNNLDFEAMLYRIINAHARAILKVSQFQLQRGPTRNVFSSEGKVVLDSRGSYLCFARAKGYLTCVGRYHVLCVHLCADKVVLVSIDVRTGRRHLRDTGDLAAASHGPRFAIVSNRLNDNLTMLLEVLVRLRFDASRNNGQAHTKV
ncbi:hypothetical protein JVU11DRAFT_11949 [Chiua virens]|nr:hypothetical protein JVU11DRAFT_11949 [Chiua virens]